MSNSALLASSVAARARRRNVFVLIALLIVVTAVLALGMWHAIRESEASTSNIVAPEVPN